MAETLRLPDRAVASRMRLVLRTDLVARLLGARDVRVVLLAAGAGSGKSTLLAQWAGRDRRPFAWVSLDGADDERAVLAADVGRALDAVEAGIEEEPASRAWFAAIGRARPFVLVLDDAHVLRSGPCLAFVAALAGHLPPSSQLAIASRGEPALPLARWSVQGDLVRMGPEELAMSASEAGFLLGRAGVELGSGELGRLMRRTEGWIAGLRMAGMRPAAPCPGGPRALDGEDLLVADYLWAEVLAPLGDELTGFLVRTSILDQLSGPLCDAVLERSGSGAVLREVARANQFVRPIDGARGRYRCHPLLREALRVELREHGAAAEAALHRRAGAWYEREGDRHAAIGHALAAGDTGRAGDLVWAGVLPLLGRGRLATLARWLAEFGESEIAAVPSLALAAAWSGLERGDPVAARRWTAVAEGGAWQRPLSGGPDTVAAAAAILRAATAAEGLRRMAEDAAFGLAGDDPAGGWGALCGVLRGVAFRLEGNLAGARACLGAAERHALTAPAPSIRVLALTQLAAAAAESDDWDGAADLVERARAVAEREGLRNDASQIGTCAVSALVRARLGLSADAAQEARRCLRLLAARPYVPPWLAADARILLARASLLVGDASSSRAHLREGRRVLARMPDCGQLGRRLEEAARQVEAFPLAGVVAAAPLSRAELRLLRFLPTHLSYREIGERLHVSQCTVKSQALSTYRKLDVSSRSRAVERAVALGLIPAAEAPAG